MEEDDMGYGAAEPSSDEEDGGSSGLPALASDSSAITPFHRAPEPSSSDNTSEWSDVDGAQQPSSPEPEVVKPLCVFSSVKPFPGANSFLAANTLNFKLKLSLNHDPTIRLGPRPLHPILSMNRINRI